MRSVFFNGLSATLRCVFVIVASVGVGFPLEGFGSSSLDAANISMDDDNPKSITGEGDGDGRRGVAFGVLLGVACRSRMLMSSARSLVAASRTESTPNHFCDFF